MSRTGDWAIEQEERDREMGWDAYEQWYASQSEEELQLQADINRAEEEHQMAGVNFDEDAANTLALEDCPF